MRSGKIPEAVLKRSVLKEIHAKSSVVRNKEGVGVDAAVLTCEGEMVAATTTVTLGGDIWSPVGIYRVMNDIACLGGRMESILMNLTLPEECDEQILKAIMRQSDDICKQLKIQIAGGHTEVFSAVLKPLLSITGLGRKVYSIEGKILPGDKIILTKWIGMEGTYLLAQYKKKELEQRFTGQLLEFVNQCQNWLPIQEEAQIAAECQAVYLHNLSNGGIFNGLWELAVRAGTGLEVDFKKIPVRQEIIECCELFDLNPYQLLSGGSLLLVVHDEKEVLGRLEEAEIPAAVIGMVTDKNDKLLINEDEVRYLDVPARDELWKIFDAGRRQ